VTDFAGLLLALSQSSVDFIVAGGAAATAHGSARLTRHRRRLRAIMTCRCLSLDQALVSDLAA
jgi:hypothetical protein